MKTITNCDWCEIGAPTFNVVVKGFESYTHTVCIDCVDATELATCYWCNNNATTQGRLLFKSDIVTVCDDCKGWVA